MTPLATRLDLVRDGDTLVVVPSGDLNESVYDLLGGSMAEVLTALEDPTVRHVVWDFHHTRTLGSSVLAFFVKIWKRISLRGGRMALCRVSAYEREIFATTRLDQLWPLFDCRDDAVRSVRE